MTSLLCHVSVKAFVYDVSDMSYELQIIILNEKLTNNEYEKQKMFLFIKLINIILTDLIHYTTNI